MGELPATVVDVLAGHLASAADAIVPRVHGVDVLPAGRQLGGLELTLVHQHGRELFVKDALAPLHECYDEIVIDTPPNLGLLTVDALMAADRGLAPVSAEDEGSAQGLVELRATLTQLQRLRGEQPTLQVLLTKWNPQRVMTDVIEQALRQLDVPIEARVPARAAVAQAATRRVPLTLEAPDSAPAVAYAHLADQLDTVAVR